MKKLVLSLLLIILGITSCNRHTSAPPDLGAALCISPESLYDTSIASYKDKDTIKWALYSYPKEHFTKQEIIDSITIEADKWAKHTGIPFQVVEREDDKTFYVEFKDLDGPGRILGQAYFPPISKYDRNPKALEIDNYDFNKKKVDSTSVK